MQREEDRHNPLLGFQKAVVQQQPRAGLVCMPPGGQHKVGRDSLTSTGDSLEDALTEFVQQSIGYSVVLAVMSGSDWDAFLPQGLKQKGQLAMQEENRGQAPMGGT